MSIKSHNKSVSLAILFFSVLLLASSCKSRQSYWDEAKSQFCIPSEGLVVEMPSDSCWIIADPAGLPQNVLFCAVMPEQSIGLYLCKDESFDAADGIGSVPPSEIDRFIHNIMRQPPENGEVSYSPIILEKCLYLSNDALKFNSHVIMGEIGVLFEGYVFSHKGKILAYTVTTPYPCDDTLLTTVDDVLNTLGR